MKKLAILLLAFVLVCSCFVLAACGDGDDTSSAVGTSSAADTSSAEGTSSTATTSKETSSEASVEESSEASVEEPSETPDESSEESTDEPVAAESKPLWLTHYNALGNEGSGAVMTDADAYVNSNWWFCAAFAPVEGEDGVYELVDIEDGMAKSGTDVRTLEIPEGGFVYALHTGNDYADGIDYTTNASNDMLTEARTWKVGEKFTFTGIDFENFTEVPTTTPELKWYEDGDRDYGNYVCTATFTKVG